MSTVWEQVGGSGIYTPRESFDASNMNAKEGSVTASTPGAMSSPLSGTALQQRKDEHAHRKRNRIVVLLQDFGDAYD